MKEKVYSAIKELSSKFDFKNHNDADKLAASNVADILGIKRNTASRYLNELNKEKKVIKINSRPVVFYSVSSLSKTLNLELFTFKDVDEFLGHVQLIKKENNEENGKSYFNEVIGAKGSLKEQVRQCVSSILYPTNGLPCLISGETGSGKSYLANVMFKEAKALGIIGEEAPFLTLNCAQYADNPELLSALLFGYKKGSFTGADTNSIGLIEKADGGYLFLDEVHRLSGEGQEKLFRFLDEGKYLRVGDNDERSSVVRFIFATSENLEASFLMTFLRRIPIIVKLPNLNERSYNERKALITTFIKDEAIKLNKTINITRNVIDILLNTNFKGNVGELKNLIKILSASALINQGYNNKELEININHIPPKYLDMHIENNFDKALGVSGDLRITDNYEVVYEYDEENLNFTHTRNLIYNMKNNLKQYKLNRKSNESLDEYLHHEINTFIDNILFRTEDVEIDIKRNYINKIIVFISSFLKEKHNIIFDGALIHIISQYIYYRINIEINENELDESLKEIITKFIQSKYSYEYKNSSKLIKLLSTELDLSLTLMDELLITIMYSMFKSKKTNKMPKAIILAHGYSTASSLANVGNRLFEDNIFEAFDMPLDSTTEELVAEIKHYIKSVDTKEGLIIMVDMGSLMEIHNEIRKEVVGPVALINNVSTSMVLNVASELLRDTSIEEILEKIKENTIINYKLFYPENNRKNAIITTCVTGIGTAQKIKELLEEGFKDVQLEIIPYDYKRLKYNGINDECFKVYNIVGIVGTMNPNIEGIKFLFIEEILTEDGIEGLNNIFKNLLNQEQLKVLNDNIVRMFSLNRVINSITILNAEKRYKADRKSNITTRK